VFGKIIYFNTTLVIMYLYMHFMYPFNVLNALPQNKVKWFSYNRPQRLECCCCGI